MSKFLVAGGIAALLLAGTSASSYAAVVPTYGVVDATNGNFAGTAPVGSGMEYFSFTIPLFGSYTVDGSVTTAGGSAVTFSAFNFYSGTPATGFTKLETGTEGIKLSGSKVVPDPKNWTLDNYTFTKTGTYYVGVATSAAVGATKVNYGFTGNLAVSAVPLPSSVALFGMAIAGLGVAGALGRKKLAGKTA